MQADLAKSYELSNKLVVHRLLQNGEYWDKKILKCTDRKSVV